MKLNDDFLARMREATELLRTSGPAAATAAIRRTLGNAGTPANDSGSQGETIDIDPVAGNAPHTADSASDLSSASAPDLMPESQPESESESQPASYRSGFMEKFRRPSGLPWAKPLTEQTIEDVEFNEAAQPIAQPDGKVAKAGFLSGSCANRAGSRAYKLYVPSTYRGEALPLVVMLHGCKQNPDDFAAGTGMNRLAERHGCLVLYPAQAAKANGSNCWNWFTPQHQERDRGEPSIIADMTRQIMREYKIDPERVYVAGLSAGGAMASILAAKYPELYAAVAVHSGLAVGAAHDVASAFDAMKQSRPAPASRYRQPVPAIVFHGDRDHTVHPGNGTEVLAQCMGVSGAGNRLAQMKTRKVQGNAANGRPYTQTIYFGAEEQVLAEHWTIHGSGHAWSGGGRAGSYTDPLGPDASSEMMRFFYAHARQNRH